MASAAGSPERREPFRRSRRALARAARSRWLRVYLALLVASHLVIAVWNPAVWTAGATDPPSGVERIEVEVPARGVGGADEAVGSTRTLGAWRWAPAGGPAAGSAGGRLPIVLLHGSPSRGAADFTDLAPLLARGGRTVYALDRPGFGSSDPWWPSYSIETNARVALAALDRIGVPRAHVFGWSQGGGVALWMAALEPSRVASLQLVGSIGIQEGEGSGDYHFEHAKYALGYAGLVVLPELIPHFNLLGRRDLRHAFIRDFWDTDQRPLRSIMRGLETPTLILHGRHDPLVDAWVAEAHHELIGPSRLVMLDADHFFVLGDPMGDDRQLAVAAHAVRSFVDRHDDPSAPVLAGSADHAPRARRADAAELGGIQIEDITPWWLIVLAITLACLVSEDLTVIAVGLLIVSGRIDVGVGLVGCIAGILAGDYLLWLIGRLAGRRVVRWPIFRRVVSEATLACWGERFDRHVAKAVFLSRVLPGTRLPMYLAAGAIGRRGAAFLFWMAVAVSLWTPLLLGLTALLGATVLAFFKEVLHGWWAYAAAALVLGVLIRAASYEATDLGRQRLKRDLGLVYRYEFWPVWLFYAPVAPIILAIALLRGRGLMTFTCVNPGVAPGGGVVGESKARIDAGLRAAGDAAGVPILPAALIGPEGSPEERAGRAARVVAGRRELGGFPIVVKPDVAQRGHAVRIADKPDDLLEYFRTMTRAALVQRLAAGPVEAGVLWSRVPPADPASAPVDDWPGEIFSVTRKVFPEVEGDGERTLERLIWDHPRLRMQAPVFLKRFESRLDEVLPAGETLVLARAGNHCQGTMFLDGSDWITPELRARVEELSRGFRDPETGGRLDFGRYDLRAPSAEHLRRGEGLEVVELNGVMSESTNLYDPHRPIWWAWGVLLKQWTRVFRIGRARRVGAGGSTPGRPMTAGELRRVLRDHRKGRSGPALSD